MLIEGNDRFPGNQSLAEVQWRLKTLISGAWKLDHGSAYQLVYGSNPADLFGWEDRDEDLFENGDCA